MLRFCLSLAVGFLFFPLVLSLAAMMVYVSLNCYVDIQSVVLTTDDILDIFLGVLFACTMITVLLSLSNDVFFDD